MPTPQNDDELVSGVVAVIRECPVAAAAIDAEGRITAWNEAAARLFGRPASEAVGVDLAELVALPAQRAGGLLAWDQLSDGGATTRFSPVSVLTEHHDGTALPVQLTVSSLGAGMGIAWFRPVTEVEVPAASDDLFRVIFERAPEAITILDADRQQRTVNPAGLALVGLVPGMERGSQAYGYVHPDDQALLEDRVRRREAGEEVESLARYRVSHADGSWRWLESLSLDLRDVPPISGFLVLSRDVTEAEEQRQALEAATDRLDQMDRSRNQVLSVVSHELRTPLTAIMSASEHLATDDVDRDEFRSYAELIHRNAARIEAMLTDLLLIGRMQSGSLPVDLVPVDVPALVEHVVAGHRSPGNPPVTVRTAPGPPARADASRLSQVIENLLTNALKFGGAVGVDLSVVHDNDDWVIVLADRGRGIAPDELEHVFDPFYRGPATAASTPGSGLGLSIAKGIVELHGGTLELRPRDGGGTEAVVTIPDRPREYDRVR